MSKKHKKIGTTLNYNEQLLILVSVVTGCISISAFASLFGVAFIEGLQGNIKGKQNRIVALSVVSFSAIICVPLAGIYLHFSRVLVGLCLRSGS